MRCWYVRLIGNQYIRCSKTGSVNGLCREHDHGLRKVQRRFKQERGVQR
jgi:hypothetical protein